jgi:lipopolysaccharide transport system ATP-binding protein
MIQNGDFLNYKRSGNAIVKFNKVNVLDLNGDMISEVFPNQEIKLCFELGLTQNLQITDSIDIGFSIHDEYDNLLSVCYSSYFNKFYHKTNNTLSLNCSFDFNKFSFSSKYISIKGRVTVNGIEADCPQETLYRLEVLQSYVYCDKVIPNNLGSVILNGHWN